MGESSDATVPTIFPKSSPTELLGLLVLLNGHKGSEDVARLADDLDLEIDEIFPSLEYAELLQLVKVTDGRASFTELGQKLVAGSIRERKSILREQLRRTTLFKTIVRALESAPNHQLSDEDLAQIVSLTTAPADEAVQNIVNWGRYAELFRYDAEAHRLILSKPAASSRSGSGRTPPTTGATPPGPPGSARKSNPPPPETRGAGVVPAAA